MKNHIELNEDRWNHVNNNYTKPLTHEELEEAKNNSISAALTVGKKAPIEWFEKANGKKILGLACGGRQQGLVFAVKGYDVTTMDFSVSQLQRDGMVAEREGLKIDMVQADMIKPFPFAGETSGIIFNPAPNVHMEDLENTYQEVSRVLKKGGLLMVGFMNPWVYMYDVDIVWDKSDEELLSKLSMPFNSRESEEKGKVTTNPEYGYEFSHTLETQIRGQLKNGLVMIGSYELCDRRHRLSRYGNDYVATLCIEL